MKRANADCGLRFYRHNNVDRAVITFFGDAVTAFNGPYVKFWGKGNKLFFIPSTPSSGALIGAHGRVQVSRKEYVEALRGFEGKHKMEWDDGLKMYYIEAIKNDEQRVIVEEPIEKPAEEPKAKTKTTKADAAVTDKLNSLMIECIDNDDLSGAKALLKAIRAFGGCA